MLFHIKEQEYEDLDGFFHEYIRNFAFATNEMHRQQ